MRSSTATTIFIALCCSVFAYASRLTPPILPLIVRNPYLSTWLPTARDEPWTNWPRFWNGQSQGFSIMARLHNSKSVFPLLGRPNDSLDTNDAQIYNITYATYHGATFDASTTNMTYTLQDPDEDDQSVNITLSFLSPITPTSTFRQSLPASYLTVYVSGTANVSIYLDVNGQWATGNRANNITWSLENSTAENEVPGLKSWKVQRETEQLFTEFSDQAEWGSLYFSAPIDANVSHQAGTSQFIRKFFASNGTLNNTVDTYYRTVMDEEPIFAFSKWFGSNTTNYTQSLTFTIAHIQNPVIQFAAARGLTLMRPLWATYESNITKLLAWHYADFKQARKLADKYSQDLAADAFKSGADDYVDIVALSARQVLGATHFAGVPDDPLLFMKEISSDGNAQTIDVIFPAFPFFLYTNPRWLAYLLEPLIEHMLSGQYPNTYAMHDLGSSYPNATGHPDGNDEYMPVEECGNILIMGLAMANVLSNMDVNAASVASTWEPMRRPPSVGTSQESRIDKVFPLRIGRDGDVDYLDNPIADTMNGPTLIDRWVKRSYNLWQQWTGYLVEYALEPENQLSTDDFAGTLALQTNLALKGIIGIKAMAGLAKYAGNEEHQEKYDRIAEDYIEQWEGFAISRDKTHAKVAYDWYGSWTTTYNLYADALLCFHMMPNSKQSSTGWSAPGPPGIQKPLKPGDNEDKNVGFLPHHVYQMQSDWYWNVRQKYGLPLDSRHLYTKTDWEFWAMSVAAPGVRSAILELVATWVNETSTDQPLTDLHNTEDDGGYPDSTGKFAARPVVGGHFAFLTLERACGGKAMDGLKFLNDDITKEQYVADVDLVLQREQQDTLLIQNEL